MKKYLIVVEADTNDGDYISEIKEVDEKFDFEKFNKICKVISEIEADNDHNWPSGEFCDESPSELYEGLLTEDEIDFFRRFVPHGEYGVHTIESVDVYEITSKKSLL